MEPTKPTMQGKPPAYWMEFLHKSGKKKFEGRYKFARSFKEGLAAVSTGDFGGYWHPSDIKWGFINTKGEEVIKRKYNESKDFSESMAAVAINDKWGYIDHLGKILIKMKYPYAESFSEGLAAVGVEKDETIKYGYIDKNNKMVIKPQFGDAQPFKEGIAKVSDHSGEYWLIDRSGKKIDKPVYSYNPWRSSQKGPWTRTKPSGNDYKYGFINRDGKVVIDYIFDQAYDFYDSLTSVKIGKKWGYIDKKGQIVIKPKFDEALPFMEGLGNVKVGDKWGYIDKNGKFVFEPSFSDFQYFSDGFILINGQEGGKCIPEAIPSAERRK